MTIAFAVAAALAAGYGIGRWQPYNRLSDWANWQLRFHLGRWSSRPRQAVLFFLLLITDPVRTVHAWRHRNDPPHPRSPALAFAPDQAEKRRTRADTTRNFPIVLSSRSRDGR
ncbi:hypothetical protein [Streptomyces sp. NPDC017529]|uniref:hypothetical protein n=1 Tax=Streptomyces sp. NPDC017529 TaxID=3365000 RepID=UPI00378F6F0F